MSIQGKHIVITGGGSGIGAATAQLLVKQGAKVTIMGRRESLLKEQKLSYQICDVTDEKNVGFAFDAARDENGPIWGLRMGQKQHRMGLKYLFRCVRISIRGLVRPSVGRSVGRLVRNAFVKIAEKWTFTDSKCFRQCWTRKKEGRGGRRDDDAR